MKGPIHHPDALIAEYAAGNTSEAQSLVAACHLTLCSTCQRRVQDLEALGGALLESSSTVAVSEGALDRVLARLEAEPAPAPEPPPRSTIEGNLPRPLLRYLSEAAQWKRLAPGVQQIPIPVASAKVRLVRFKPGTQIPFHDHQGSEYTLVLAGGLIEKDLVFHRGDVAVRHPDDRHEQRVEEGEPCIALLVNEAPLVALTWRGRLLKLIAGEE